jgi:hypothetical protein
VIAEASNGILSCDIGDRIIQQRRTTMNYTKPEVAVLGEAVSVIEMVINGKLNAQTDHGTSRVNPAYDLDE